MHLLVLLIHRTFIGRAQRIKFFQEKRFLEISDMTINQAKVASRCEFVIFGRMVINLARISSLQKNNQFGMYHIGAASKQYR